MNNKWNIIFTALLLVSVFSCKKGEADFSSREVYVNSMNGSVMRSEPKSSGRKISLIPFADKIVINEQAVQDDEYNKWYRLQRNGKSGWLIQSSTGSWKSIIMAFKKSFTEKKHRFTESFREDFNSSKLEIENGIYRYSGGEMEGASMFFLSNGILAVHSKLFTPRTDYAFFKYNFMNEGKLLKIIFVDSSMDFKIYADVESLSSSVFKIDEKEKSIIYHVKKDNSFFFFNWRFSKID